MPGTLLVRLASTEGKVLRRGGGVLPAPPCPLARNRTRRAGIARGLLYRDTKKPAASGMMASTIKIRYLP